jgi:hypothetical protein
MSNARENERPEALATFAEAARAGGKKPDDLGLEANEHTAPIPADPHAKHEAATKVLRRGVTGLHTGAYEAIDRLPDRIVESRGHGWAGWQMLAIAVLAGFAASFMIARLAGLRSPADERY